MLTLGVMTARTLRRPLVWVVLAALLVWAWPGLVTGILAVAAGIAAVYVTGGGRSGLLDAGAQNPQVAGVVVSLTLLPALAVTAALAGFTAAWLGPVAALGPVGAYALTRYVRVAQKPAEAEAEQ